MAGDSPVGFTLAFKSGLHDVSISQSDTCNLQFPVQISAQEEERC